jgi:hypothetical protein
VGSHWEARAAREGTSSSSLAMLPLFSGPPRSTPGAPRDTSGVSLMAPLETALGLRFEYLPVLWSRDYTSV